MAGSVSAAVGLVTFAFINLILFIVLANPFGMVTDQLESEYDDITIDKQQTPHPISGYYDNLKTIFGLMFVFSMIGLVIWAFLSSHSEEYESY